MPSYSVVLVEPKYEGNVGSVARVMKNFGFSELVLVKPPKLDKEARAMAMHGRDVLDAAKVLGSFSEAKKEFDFLVATSAIVATDANFLRTPVPPSELAVASDLEGRIGLFFGREDYGLFNEEIEACDMLISIPTDPAYPTLNLSHSVAVLLYELSRQRLEKKREKLKKLRRANSLEKEVLLDKFDGFADAVREKEHDRRLVKKTFRQVIGRAFISGREASTLTGLFRRAARKIRD